MHFGLSTVMPHSDIFLFLVALVVLAVLVVVLAGLLVARSLRTGLDRRRVTTTLPARGELPAALPSLGPAPAAKNIGFGAAGISGRRCATGQPVNGHTGDHSRACATSPDQSAPLSLARFASERIPLDSQLLGRTAEAASALVARISASSRSCARIAADAW